MIIDYIFLKFQTNVFEWRIVFIMAGGFYGIANLLFVVFGQTKIQPWNDSLPQPAEMKLMQPRTVVNEEQKEKP